MNPELEYCAEFAVEVNPPLPFGPTPGEGLHYAAITGGSVHGEHLSGRIVPGGADWWTGDGLTVQLDARYVIEVDVTDGTALVDVRNRGVWRTDEATWERMCAGETVSEQELYYRTAFTFHTAHPDLLWLVDSQFVGYARPENNSVVIRVFRLK